MTNAIPPIIRIVVTDRIEPDASITRVTTRYATDVVNLKNEIAFSTREEPNFDLGAFLAERAAMKELLVQQISDIDAAIAASASEISADGIGGEIPFTDPSPDPIKL
jgi:hypothetical protein